MFLPTNTSECCREGRGKEGEKGGMEDQCRSQGKEEGGRERKRKWRINRGVKGERRQREGEKEEMEDQCRSQGKEEGGREGRREGGGREVFVVPAAFSGIATRRR